MDIIEALISTKKQNNHLYDDLKTMLTDLIKYQKLSRLPMYKSLYVDGGQNEELIKLTNVITRALTFDPYWLYLLTTALDIISYLDSQFSLNVRQQIIDQIGSRRKLKQLAIIGANTCTVSYTDLSAFSDADDQSILVLTNAINEQSTLVSLIVFTKEKHICVYHGTIDSNLQETQQKSEIYKPFNYQGVSILTYSNQGNNDYNFATYKGYGISMPNGHCLQYQNKNNKYKIELTNEEQQQIQMAQTLDVIARLIIKHFRES